MTIIVYICMFFLSYFDSVCLIDTFMSTYFLVIFCLC